MIRIAPPGHPQERDAYLSLGDAYETIKSNPGNMVKGNDPETLDGISES
jgi:hypothetical protein